MRPCQQCDGGYPIGVWMSALLIFMLLIAWKHWPRMGWAGRVGIFAACAAILGGSIATSYWQGTTDSTGGTCGICVMPVITGPTIGASTQSAVVTTTSSAPSGESSVVSASSDVVAFYFHRTARCHTCLQIEEWARLTIEGRFAGELAGGLIQWRSVNIEEPGNEHFEKDYELTTQSLVLVRIKYGRPAQWKNLKSVWELSGDYGRFTEYVETEVSSFLNRASGM
jgi:hypothetical protein